MGDAAASRIAAAALRAACPWASDVRIEERYEDDLIRVTRDGAAFMVEVCGRTLVISADAFHDDADVKAHTEARDTQIVNRIVVDYTRQNCRRGFARARAGEGAGPVLRRRAELLPGNMVRACCGATSRRGRTSKNVKGTSRTAWPRRRPTTMERARSSPSSGPARPSPRRGAASPLSLWSGRPRQSSSTAAPARCALGPDTDEALDALDAVWVSHAHWDHFGGLAALVAAAARRRGRSNEDVARALRGRSATMSNRLYKFWRRRASPLFWELR